MNIKEFRLIAGMTQQKFADYFGIPVGTLRNWEQGIATPPGYVFQMIKASIRRDKMLNVETIKFIHMLNKLATLTENGIDEFENATIENIDRKVFYDKNQPDENGNYKIVLDHCLIDHHDAISYYGDHSTEYSIAVTFDDDEKPYIHIKLSLSDEEIIIEDGEWHFI